MYSNLISISETLDWVARGRLAVPGDCRTLVENASHPGHLGMVARRLGPKWSLLHSALYRAEGDKAAQGARSSLTWRLHPLDGPNLLDPGDEARIRTRMGADRISVDVSFTSFTGNRISSLGLKIGDLPDGWRGTVRLVSETEERAVVGLGGNMFAYDRFGLRKVKEPT